MIYYSALIAASLGAVLFPRMAPYACLLLADWAVWVLFPDNYALLIKTDILCAVLMSSMVWMQWDRAGCDDSRFPMWEAVSSCAMWSAIVVHVVFWSAFEFGNVVLGDFYVWGMRSGFLMAMAALVVGGLDAGRSRAKPVLAGVDSGPGDLLSSGHAGYRDCSSEPSEASGSGA